MTKVAARVPVSIMPPETEMLKVLGSPALYTGMSGILSLLLIAILGKMGGPRLIATALVAAGVLAALLRGISMWSPDMPLYGTALIKVLIFVALPPFAFCLLMKSRAAGQISSLLTTPVAFVCAAFLVLAGLAAGPDQAIATGQPASGGSFQDTYYMVNNLTAHFVLSVVFLLFALAHGLIRRACPSGYLEWVGLVQFWTLFAGSYLAQYPHHFLGTSSMPRRYIDYPDHLAVWNHVAATGSGLIFASVLIFLVLAGYGLLLRKRNM